MYQSLQSPKIENIFPPLPPYISPCMHPNRDKYKMNSVRREEILLHLINAYLFDINREFWSFLQLLKEKKFSPKFCVLKKEKILWVLPPWEVWALLHHAEVC